MRLFETRYGIEDRQKTSWRPDQSENNVLMAILLAFWRWLTSPTQAAASLPAYPLTRPSIAALPAARPRFVLLAPIHVPWRRRPS